MTKTGLAMLISGCLLAAGAVIGGAGYVMGGSGFYIDQTGAHVYDEKNVVKDSMELPAFDKIEMDSSALDVTLVESDHYGLEYQLYEPFALEQTEVSDGTLKVRTTQQGGFRINFMLGLKNQSKLMVYYPSGTEFEKAQFSLKSGSLRTEMLSVEEMDVKMTSGECVLDGLTGSSVQTDMSSGRFQLSNAVVNEVGVKITSGTVLLSNVNAKQSARIDASSGTIRISDMETQKLGVSLTSGDVHLADCHVGKLEGELSSGRLSGERVDTTGIDYRLTSGSVALVGAMKGDSRIHAVSGDIRMEVSLPESEYGYLLTTSSGSGYVNGKQTDGKRKEGAPNSMELSVTSGAIHLDFAS